MEHNTKVKMFQPVKHEITPRIICDSLLLAFANWMFKQVFIWQNQKGETFRQILRSIANYKGTIQQKILHFYVS